MLLKSFSTAPVSTCSSACDCRYGTQQREPHKHCTADFFFWTCWMALRWPWKQRWQDYPRQALKRLPISNCSGKNEGEYAGMKVTLAQCGEEGSGGIVLESKTVPGLRFAERKTWPTHFHWRQLAVLEIAACTVEAGNWLRASGKLYYVTWLCLSKYSKMKQCVLNPTISIHILTWQRYGSYIHCIIYKYISFVAPKVGC